LQTEIDWQACAGNFKGDRRGTTTMAEILSFQARPRTERDIGEAPKGGAQILFFTGVRYVRAEPCADVPTTPAGGGKTPRSRRNRRRQA
jgi:hypothetical protein